MVGGAFTKILTWLDEAVQGALVIVHWNTYVPAVVIAVIVVEGEPGVVMIAVTGPLTCVHEPAPADGAFPAMVAEPGDEQIV